MASVEDNAPTMNHGYDYDLVVVGGGSGGLALSREAVKFGAKVAVLDFVKPSPQGTVWGLGGTCVNVGCIPKKLMHTAGLMKDTFKDAPNYGWTIGTPSHSWETLVNNVQDHIGSLNWGYRTALREETVEYKNAYGVFVDPHTIEITNRAKKTERITARRFVIACGGRPTIPDDIPGAKEHAISSDDIFSRTTPPGKTLVVGASYVALECAGFLSHLGFETTVMARSILLRGFDQQIAEQIGGYMERHGTKFLRPAVPTSITKGEDGRLTVNYQFADGKTSSDVYDTVMFAVGRTADTAGMNLPAAGVTVNPRNLKIPVTHEQSNVPHIYAIGDVIDGGLELTPVAIQAGRMLARRLFGNATEQMNYRNVATAVFTPIEYGAIGYSEEDAEKAFGKDAVEVYHAFLQPLEYTVAHRDENDVFAKLIVTKANDVVVGLHYLGPNAGEVIMGYSVAINMGATKAMFDRTVGIHPTVAEEFTDMHITKASGKDPKRTGC